MRKRIFNREVKIILQFAAKINILSNIISEKNIFILIKIYSFKSKCNILKKVTK